MHEHSCKILYLIGTGKKERKKERKRKEERNWKERNERRKKETGTKERKNMKNNLRKKKACYKYSRLNNAMVTYQSCGGNLQNSDFAT